MAETSSLPDYPRGITFEQVWAALMEHRELIKETDRQMKETDQRLKETEKLVKENAQLIKETDAQIKETAAQIKRTDAQIKRTDRQIGGLHNSFGELAEHLVAPGIVERFNEMGFHFDTIADRGLKLCDGNRKIKAEIDILLENSTSIIAVEVKSSPKDSGNDSDIEHHKKRLAILREHRQGDKRKILGAIAGAVFKKGVKEAILDAGFYVLEQSGDTMEIYIPEGFKPSEW